MLTLGSPHSEFLEELEKIRLFYILKKTMRYETWRDHEIHSESVAEHLFAMEILAQYFYPLEDPEGKLDKLRVHELILFHELGEIETGDIVFHRKTDDHRQEEQRAVERVAGKIPNSLQKIALERSREFDECQTPEALYATAIDKIEPVFELYEEKDLVAFNRLKVTREVAVNGKKKATEKFPYMRRFLEAWEDRAVSLDIFPSTMAV